MQTSSKNATLKASYTYNSLGQRTRKDRPGKNSFLYHYDLQGNLIMESNQKSKPLFDYIWVDGSVVKFTQLKGKNNGTINTEKVSTFISNNHLNTPRIGTNDTQAIVWQWDSDAFGIKQPKNNPDGDATKVNLNLRFPGQYRDSETGLYYNWNRYYDPSTGRYITSDPIGLDGGINTYGYVGRNPLIFSDFLGLKHEGNGCEDGLGNQVPCPPGICVAPECAAGIPDFAPPSDCLIACVSRGTLKCKKLPGALRAFCMQAATAFWTFKCAKECNPEDPCVDQ